MTLDSSHQANQANQHKTLRNRVLILGALVTLAIVLIALVGVPFWVSRGTFGRTFLDKPGFSIVAVNLSKEGTDCYIRSTISNTGNVYIARLTLNLNGTYLRRMDGFLRTGSMMAGNASRTTDTSIAQTFVSVRHTRQATCQSSPTV